MEARYKWWLRTLHQLIAEVISSTMLDSFSLKNANVKHKTYNLNQDKKALCSSIFCYFYLSKLDCWGSISWWEWSQNSILNAVKMHLSHQTVMIQHFLCTNSVKKWNPVFALLWLRSTYQTQWRVDWRQMPLVLLRIRHLTLKNNGWRSLQNSSLTTNASLETFGLWTPKLAQLHEHKWWLLEADT